MHLDFFVKETVYSGCAFAFFALILLMGLQGRTSRAGVAILGCCIASLTWASATTATAPVAALSSLDSLRLSAWLLFAVALVTIRASDGSGLGRAYLLGAVGFCLAAIVDDLWTLIVSPDATALYTSQQLIRIGFGVAGLLTIENFWRNTEPERRWHVWPLCVAIGGYSVYYEWSAIQAAEFDAARA